MGNYYSSRVKKYLEGKFNVSYLEYVDRFIEDDIDLWVRNRDSETLLHISLKHIATARDLDYYKFDDEKTMKTQIFKLIRTGIKRKMSFSLLKLSLKIYEVRIDDSYFLKLLKYGADINAKSQDGESLVSYFCRKHKTRMNIPYLHIRAIKILFEHGMRFDDDLIDLKNILIALIPDFNKCIHGRSFLNNRIIKEIVEKYTDIEPDQKLSRKPILIFLMDLYRKYSFCTSIGYISKLDPQIFFDLFKMFLQKGADPDLPNKKGETPLIFACKHSLNDCALHLIKVGADMTGARKCVKSYNRKLFKAIDKRKSDSSSDSSSYDSNDEIIKIDLG